MSDTMGASSKGVFTQGTVKPKTLNMYDSHAEVFQAFPDGPYEQQNTEHHPSAQDHFNATREIKLKEPLGSNLPLASYRDHYPPKALPIPGENLDLTTGPAPFTARTEYTDQYFDKPWAPRPVEPIQSGIKAGPMLVRETTNNYHFKPYELPIDQGKDQHLRQAVAAPFFNDMGTTYRHHFPAKDPPPKMVVGVPGPRAPLPWLVDGTTYTNHYTAKDLSLVLPAGWEAGQPFAFNGITEYTAEFVPKESPDELPHLTGVRSPIGLQLPLPRRSLGVEFWHKGKADHMFILIPRHLDVPCAAKQIFTTVTDDQEEACILVMYGDDPVASNNLLLGQFDIVNIPPAPKDVPRIEVRFHLNRNMYLTVEARDLDTARHKRWVQRGDIVVLRA